MSEVNTSSSGAVAEESGAQVAGGASESEAIKRAKDAILSELKAERQKRREYEEKIQALEAERLLEQGKLKEYAESLKSKAEKLEQELKMTKSNYAFTTVKSQIERKALELGCIDTELLLKAIDLDKIQVDDTFTVDTHSLSDVLESTRRSKPFLFKQEGPKVRDGVPGTVNVGGKPDLSKMTKQQLLEYARQSGIS